MSIGASTPNNNNFSKGLPPVKPPSGRFIVQLFLIPGLIVAGLVLVFVFGGVAWVGSSSPQSFLQQIDNPNPDIRWRGAHELAQVLERPESIELASNPDFALDLALRLQAAVKDLEAAEDSTKLELEETFKQIKANRKLNAEEKEAEQEKEALKAWRKLRPQRDLVFFLTSSMGHVTIPVGVHVLGQIAMKDKGAEVKGTLLRRRAAVLALSNLGHNVQKNFFGKWLTDDAKTLSPLQKIAVREKLAEASEGTSQRAKLASYAYGVLFNKEPAKVDMILEVCAHSDDLYLRNFVCQALNFWEGPRVEPTLLMLAHDDGHGTMIQVNDPD
jgi:hypothetical protein